MKTKAGPLLHEGARPIGEKCVWHMKTNADPLLHGGGL